MKMKLIASCLALSLFPLAATASRPNVLFISIDDLNDWIGCMGGHPQAVTPNFDRLAASGVLFTNAHCPAPACNPSRTAIMTGMAPNRSGMYSNRQVMRELLPDAVLMPKYFTDHGYWSGGSGKILHYFIDARSWDEYFPEKEKEDPFPFTYYPEKRPVSLPVGGPWQYDETDWGPLPVDDEEFGGDYSVSKWVGEKLKQKHDKPFFLACGIYRPHEPWFVPAKYFDKFPLEEIQLPPGYLEDDLDDLPPAGKKTGPNRYFAHIREHKQWKQGIQGYLASISFADAMLGRVLDALDEGPNKDNTIVVLWSDHGWHLGEKQHWQKYTVWRLCSRVPLMVRVPKGAPGLAAGTRAGGKCNRPVSLVSLYPTLLELCGLPPKEDNDGPSLVPLLADPQRPWNNVAVTYLHQVGGFGLSTDDYRYIHYATGDEELYQISTDRYEWRNLAENPEHAAKLKELRAKAPKEFKEYVPATVGSLGELGWHPGDDAPPSKPDGNPFIVHFINQSENPVLLWWMTPTDGKKKYGEIKPTKSRKQQTRPGAIWMVTDLQEKQLGWWQVGDRTARAVVP
jgi:arylsulfatase A-like enzyme